MILDDNGQQVQLDAPFLEAVAAHVERVKSWQPQTLRGIRKARRQYERQLHNRWKRAFNRFDVLIVQMRDTAIQFIEEHQSQVVTDEDELFLVLAWLQGRASITASEIRALLFSGHINGAFARWRTLHEISVVMSFLMKYPETVERYRLHQYIHLQKLTENMATEAAIFGWSMNDIQEIQAKAQKRRQELCTQFGKSFKGDYGWAVEALGRDRDLGQATIVEIEAAVNLQHRRAMFRRASSNVHAVPSRETFEHHSRFEDLSLTGLTMVTFDPMPDVTPSETAAATLKSLLHCLAMLLQQRKSGGELVCLVAFEQLIDETHKVFQQIDETMTDQAPAT